jgi:hypothetical protein
MTCTHVLGLIDAGPLADYPRAHLDAAWRHARTCATCGPALDAATGMTADLPALPQVAPPPDLVGTVLARIARAEDARTASASAAADPDARDWAPWITALGALGAALVVTMAPRVPQAPADLLAMPEWTLGLTAACVLYAAGLFAPLGRR